MLQPIQRSTDAGTPALVQAHHEPQPPDRALQPYGTELVTEMTADGPDFIRYCDEHSWASLPAATPDDTGRCPFCQLALENSRGLTRWLRLKGRLSVRG